MPSQPPPSKPSVEPAAPDQTVLDRVRLGQLDEVERELARPEVDVLSKAAIEARALLFEPRGHEGFELSQLISARDAFDPLMEATLADAGRFALLDFDGAALKRLAHLGPPDAESLVPELLQLFSTIVARPEEFQDERARQLESAAGAAQDAEIVLDGCMTRALGAESAGSYETALEFARRGSRMARTEARPLHEFFAHLILARARRLSRHPHLALRVLTSLAQYAPPSFQPWIAWELFFAGAEPEEIETRLPELQMGPARSRQSVSTLFELVEAAQSGDRDEFRRLAQALETTIESFGPARSDAQVLIRALHPTGGDSDDQTLDDWQAGRTDVAPASIHGLCVRVEGDEDEEVSEAYVMFGPGREPRRILGLGAPLLQSENAVRLRRTRRKQGRVETMAAVLALAGSRGLALADAFLPAYGFAYVPELHKGVVDVLMQRVRSYFGDTAELVRHDGHVALVPQVLLLVPDPRSAPGAYDRVLRILARVGRAKASDAAQASGLSVRATQNALKELIGAGLCTAEKKGKQVLYAVEDTTFSEPTQLIKRTRPLDL